MHGAPPLVPLLDGTADVLRGVVDRAGERHTLTEIERQLVRYLAERPGEPISREQLLVDVWGYAPNVRSRAADHTIARLRTKLEPDPAHPQLLLTARGVGYRWAPPAPVAAVSPPPRADLIGREAERQALRDAVAAHRVVCLVGPMGVGTSALAAELGWFALDLSGATSLPEALARIARELHVTDEGVDVATLAPVLRARGQLWLDGVEGVPGLAAALAAWSGTRFVLTSRRRIDGVDHTLRVGPLALDAAVALLQRQAQATGAAHPDWSERSALEALAERLDGLPLALHVAAAQASWLSPAQVIEQLERSPAALLEGPHGLMSSVRAAIERLTPQQRALLEYLASFRAAPLAAVDAQGGLAQLRALVDGSLVWAEARRGAMRYRLLRPVADSVRALSADGLHTAEQVHAAWVSAEARRRAGHPCHDVEDPTWWHANVAEVLLAVDRTERAADRAHLALCLVRLASFGWLSGATHWLLVAAEAAARADDPSLRCAAYAMRARLDPTAPDDDLAAAAALAVSEADRAMVLHHRAMHAIDSTHYEQALAFAQQAIAGFAAAGHLRGALDAEITAVDALHPLGRGVEAHEACTRAIRLAQQLDDVRGLGIAYAIRGYAAPSYAAALDDQQRALDLLESVHDLNASVRIRLIRARMMAMGGDETEPLPALLEQADALGNRRLSTRARFEIAAAALHAGDRALALQLGAGPPEVLDREGFGLLRHGLRLARGEPGLVVQGLEPALSEVHPPDATAAYFYVVAALLHDDEAGWEPAVATLQAHVEATEGLQLSTPFLGLYGQLVEAFRAGLAMLRGDAEAARAGLRRADAVAEPLPQWRKQAGAWRALVEGQPLPALEGLGMDGWVLAALQRRMVAP